MDRVWSLDFGKDNSYVVAIGFDEGTLVLKIGTDDPLASIV
jgi:hypothetical protein